MQFECLKIGLDHTESYTCQVLGPQIVQTFSTMVPVSKKFSTSFSLSVKDFCFSLVFFCENFQYLITFNEVSESIEGLQIRDNLANCKNKKFSGHNIR